VEDEILSRFPSHAHALVLVSDPDGLLADEGVVAALAEGGFTLVSETDPVLLRHRVEQARPWSVDTPLLVVTTGPLNQLPYDLWQQGQHVELSLHGFFPNLSYPIVRALSPSQRWQLSQTPSPPHRLGRQASLDHILRHAFSADPDALREPAHLVGWLNDYHTQAEPKPPLLAEPLLARLRWVPAYAEWPLEDLLADREAFALFLGGQWRSYVQRQTDQPLADTPSRYFLSFEADDRLQDALPGLVRSGCLAPVAVEQLDRLPLWARSGVLASDRDRMPRRASELLGLLGEHLRTRLADARWEQWQAVARSWAELNTLRHNGEIRLDEAQRSACTALQETLDAAFLTWLRRRYAPLGSQRLPAPHHLFHAPHYLAYQRRQAHVKRPALLILDGLSLEDWTLVGPAWRARHPDWTFDEHLLLGQVPTVTEVSRTALVSGLRPADLSTVPASSDEPHLWAAFWAQEGLAEEACACVHLALDRADAPPLLGSARLGAVCLIDTRVDDTVHNASLGAADQQASLRVWLESYSRKLEVLLADLLAGGYTLYVASDHGHVEAVGMGQPSEGLTVQSRGKRARLYTDRRAAVRVQQAFPKTVLWGHDGLLPDNLWALMPEGRLAFATAGQPVVTHGGPTLDEMVVPLVRIKRG
jgi:hypothetical protein